MCLSKYWDIRIVVFVCSCKVLTFKTLYARKSVYNVKNSCSIQIHIYLFHLNKQHVEVTFRNIFFWYDICVSTIFFLEFKTWKLNTDCRFHANFFCSFFFYQCLLEMAVIIPMLFNIINTYNIFRIWRKWGPWAIFQVSIFTHK